MKNEKRQNVQVDSYTRVCLTAITVLLTVLVIGLWSEIARPTQASAAVYRDEKARKSVEQGRWGTSSAVGKHAAIQKETNENLRELIRLFRTGEAKVQVVAQPGGSKKGSNDTIRP